MTKTKATITVTATVEKVGNKNFACYTTDKIDNCALAGYGETPKEAIEDMDLTYEEIKELNAENGVETPSLRFTYDFDVPSLFAYLNWINVTKFSQFACINASLMRQYVSGSAKASAEQKRKIDTAVNNLINELELITK